MISQSLEVLKCLPPPSPYISAWMRGPGGKGKHHAGWDGACPCPELDAALQAAPVALGLESIYGKR